MRDRTRRLHEQAQPRRDAEPLFLAVTVAALPVDVFEREIRLAVGGDAGVVQASDVRWSRLARISRSRAMCAARSPLNGPNGSFKAPLRCISPSARSASHTAPMPPTPSSRTSRYAADHVACRMPTLQRRGGGGGGGGVTLVQLRQRTQQRVGLDPRGARQ